MLVLEGRKGRKKLHFTCFGWGENCCVFPCVIRLKQEHDACQVRNYMLVLKERKGRKRLDFSCFGRVEDCCVFPCVTRLEQEHDAYKVRNKLNVSQGRKGRKKLNYQHWSRKQKLQGDHGACNVRVGGEIRLEQEDDINKVRCEFRGTGGKKEKS